LSTPLTLDDVSRQTLQVLPEAVVVTNLEARILLWNTAAERLYGWAATEVMGLNIVDVVPSEQSREQGAQIMGNLSRGESWEGQFPVRHRDGSSFVAWVTDVPLTDGSGELVGVVGLSRDISVTRGAGRNLAILSMLAPILGASLDYEKAADQACRALAPAFADVAIITVAEPPGPVRRLAAAAADPEYLRRLLHAPMSEHGAALAGRVVATGRPELVGAADNVVGEWGFSQGLIAPMVAHGKAFGTVAFGMFTGTGRCFSAGDLSFAEDLGHRVGLAVENAFLHTRLRASEAAATAALQRAVMDEQQKDTFLAMLGHELRNPLAPIVSALELVSSRRPLDREEAIISRQVNHMVKLVDDLLDVSRTSRNSIVLNRQPLEMSDVVISALEMVGPLIQQRMHHLSVEVPSQGLRVHGDPTRLAQVVSNLLVNAARHMEVGGSIRVRAWREEDTIAVSVVDEGVGISAEALPHIFDVFVQGPQSVDRAQGGLGVGLTIARSLMELHGGTLAAASGGAGRGSEFVARLPSAAHAVLCPRPAAPENLPAPGAQRFRVLVVDDNIDALEALADLLRAFGHEVSTADDGPAALRLAATLPLDAVVLDIGLPFMDGYEVAERLHQRSPHLRLIAVTGYGQPNDRARSQAAGFATHLLKPIDVQTLMQALAG
jgi:PAS domain S-box-containing protein